MIPSFRILVVCLFSIILAACGGGGSGSGSKKGSSSTAVSVTTTTTTTYYGVFQGSIVTGVHYKAQLNGQVKEGETDSEGKFQYFVENGVISPVTFSVGGVTLGAVTPPSTSGSFTMNVFDLVNANDPDANTKSINIQRFLSTINSSGNSNVIQVTSAVRTALAAESIKLNETLVADFDAKANTMVGSMISASALASGTTLATAATVQTHMNETKSQIDALRVGTVSITSGADSVLADGLTKVLIRVQAMTVDNKVMSGGLVHFETTAGTLGSEAQSVLCGATPTTTQSVDKITDSTGMAYLMLTPTCKTANAVVSVSLGGKIVLKTVQFVPGPATTANSTITVSPKTLPADGLSTSTVTVSLKDANNNPVADKTPVTLLTDIGNIASSAATTVSGRATFTFTAPNTNGTATLTVSEYSFLSDTITIGGLSSTGGKPNSIQMSSALNQIFIRGVGKTEIASISIQARDDVGDPINETALGYASTSNNLRVTLKTHPQGGETIAGIGRNTTTGATETKKSTTTTNSIEVRSTNGSATITLTGGTRPGVVEFQVDALDTNGTILATAISPLITIASGPPHNITLSEAYKDGIINMKDFGRGGVYCLLGSALVTDRYGNAVPDGTTISLNLIDTVLSSKTTGSITTSSVDLTDADGKFLTDGVTTPSGINRKIQAGDQVLIEKGVLAQNRRRFVASSPLSDNTLATNTAYSESLNPLTYYVGAALQGGAIHGFSGQQSCDPSQLTTGITKTIGGIAPIRVTYPANADTIQLGCLGYTNDTYDINNIETRFSKKSGQVLIIAAINNTNDTIDPTQNSGSTIVTKGKFCFTAQGPATMKSDKSTLNATSPVTISLIDNANIIIPFVPIQCSASDPNNVTISSGTTDKTGSMTVTASIANGLNGRTPAYTSTITCTNTQFNASTSITVLVP